jgi:multiple sugar transport system substrate-binding protein
LPNPPQTIDELIDVATFFNDKDWDNDGVKERGFVISRGMPYDLMYWYALSFTTPYTVMPASVADGYHLPHGLFLFKPDMTPLVSTPGFKLGVSKWLTLARLADPNARRQDVIDQIVKGEALMAIDWGDTGPAALAGNSVVRGNLGFALAPGTRSYYDWKAAQPAMVDTTEVNYAPLNQANGFAFYMTSTSQHKAAVWRFIKYMNSKDVSMAIVSDSRGGYQPWRTSHSNNLDNWVQAGWKTEDAQNYVQTILASTNHPNASLDIRMPGVFSYGAVLERHLANLLNTANADSTAIDAEMDACAKDMEAVTDANIREAQKAAYERHLGIHQ